MVHFDAKRYYVLAFIFYEGIKFLFVFSAQSKFALTIYPENINTANEVFTFEDKNIGWPDWCKSSVIENSIANLNDLPKPSLDELLSMYKGILKKNPDGTINKLSSDPVDISLFVGNDNRFICQFNYWVGDFDARCIGLKTLVGGPKVVRGNYNCQQNDLTSLEGGPDTVAGNFICCENVLTSLEGGPSYVRGNYICRTNMLTTLKGCPKTTYGIFDCDDNPLTSLKEGPKLAFGNFCCDEHLKDEAEKKGYNFISPV